MLLRDIPPAKIAPQAPSKRRRHSHQTTDLVKKQSLSGVSSRQKSVSSTKSVVTPLRVVSTPRAEKPLWLKSLIILNHSSAFVCYVSVALALVMYGMTVHAPKLWSQKYNQLQELQKKERQFTFTDEMLKDELAQSAVKSQSGFVKPNPSKQPIFLPNTITEPLKSKPSNSAQPQKITPIAPIAY